MTTESKSETIWSSGQKKSLYVLLGLPLVAILGWYAYTVAFHYKAPELTRMEMELARQFELLADETAAMIERGIREGFKPEEVENCRVMTEQYETPQGWVTTSAALHELVGLSRDASKEMLDERCVYFAKVVAAMETISHHARHVFVCGDSYFDILNGGYYTIRPDPERRGAIQNVTSSWPKLVKINPGSSTMVLNHWQLYNVGDGCLIIGLSKTGAFRFSGRVLEN